MQNLPQMRNFRVEPGREGVIRLIFDMPDRTMNVFSNEAIHEMEAFADWLRTADVPGVVIASGKSNAFCAGADLGELSQAYDMIMAAPATERDALAAAHFAPIGRGLRKLETAGKPVAVAVHGLALGGGCEFALGGHYRVLTDTPETQIGLPESLVGLLPGGGGTQRLPRLIGIAASFPVLLDGGRLDAATAVAVGAADQAVPPGQEIAAAEAWVLSRPDPRQPWDRDGWQIPTAAAVTAETAPRRAAVLAATGGHYPAELAILDCLDRGLTTGMDAGIAAELDIFKDLVQRIEPRNMIAAGFLGRVEYDRRKRKSALPAGLDEFAAAVRAALTAATGTDAEGQAAAVFCGLDGAAPGDAAAAAAIAARQPQWFLDPQTATERRALQILSAAVTLARQQQGFDPADHALIDYHCSRTAGFPRYLGGPFTLAALLG